MLAGDGQLLSVANFRETSSTTISPSEDVRGPSEAVDRSSWKLECYRKESVQYGNDYKSPAGIPLLLESEVLKMKST